jgi:alpha,alpha-trehalose phosphorylase
MHDTHHNVHNGLHIASLAGAWLATVAGFGGMRDHGGHLTFAPRLPSSLPRIAFRMCFLASQIQVEIRADAATYHLLSGDPLRTAHHGSPFTLTADRSVTLPIPEAPALPTPAQPPGREPEHPGPHQS